LQTISLKPQGDGTNRGWSSVVGASFAYQAVDDSDGTTHDSAETYFRLPRLDPAGTVSFPFFRGWGGGIPSTVTVNVVAKRVAAAHPKIQIGFVRGGSFGFSGALFDTTATWDLATRAFITDPITGLAWDPELLPVTEVCLRSEALVVGNNDVTLVSAAVTYREPRNFDPILPPGAGL
jgi:hypothetical protein